MCWRQGPLLFGETCLTAGLNLQVFRQIGNGPCFAVDYVIERQAVGRRICSIKIMPVLQPGEYKGIKKARLTGLAISN